MPTTTKRSAGSSPPPPPPPPDHTELRQHARKRRLRSREVRAYGEAIGRLEDHGSLIALLVKDDEPSDRHRPRRRPCWADHNAVPA